MVTNRFPTETYTVGWVCALPLELQAARAMLDEAHQDPSREPHETNIYCLGRIGEHNVVIVCLPAGRYGTNSAAACVAQMMEKFRSIKFGLLVGIAGGVPSHEADVRLGDVVISQPRGQYGGVVQYDLGKIEAGGRGHRTGYLSPPPTILLNALAKYQALGRDQNNHVIDRLPLTQDVQRPESDTLYESTYDHAGGATCRDCDSTKVKRRQARAAATQVHYGVIASGNQVVKDGLTRDRLSRELGGVLCFEMEAAGVVNILPCLVIRGICDYCDSHKNKEWQKYAATVAALRANDLFDIIPAVQDTEVAAGEEARARFEAMFATDHFIDRANIITAKGARVDGTCEWIRENRSYNSWLDPHSEPFLWICGGPGKGKTMLAIYLTEELERFTQDLDGDLVFYFCGQEGSKRNTATAVLRGFIYQVIAKKPWLFRYAQHFFDTQEKADYVLSSPEALWTIFQDMAQDAEIGLIYYILDGLDECDEESIRFLGTKFSQLFILSKSRPRSFGYRLAVVSREIHALKGSSTIQLDRDFDEQVNSDIQRFVLSRVQELYRVDGFTSELAKHVQNTLLQRSEGTFLWVGFVINELLQKTTCTELLDSLESLPRGLPGIYCRILLRIDERQRKVCALILLWVALAFRPLTLHELAHVINLQNSTVLSREQAILDQLALCKPLLRVQDGEVSLIHQSVRDYLLRDNHDEDPIVETFRIKSEEGHFAIVQTCLDVIERSCCHYGPGTGPQDLSLLKYAIHTWPNHAQSAGVYGDAIFDMSRPMFQENSQALSNWLKESVDVDRDSFHLTTLHIASMYGLTTWARKILARKRWKLFIKHSLNKKDAKGFTPLDRSAEAGHEAATHLLLENGAGTGARNSFNKPLLLAASKGHDLVVRLLLRYGADINSQDKDGSTLLMIACILKNLKMAQLLIAHGININLLVKRGTAIEAAIFNSADDIFELLIQHGAQIDIKDERGMTPLARAMVPGQMNRARKLLVYGANPNCQDSTGTTPMIRAVTYGWLEGMIPMLLEYGADINQVDNDGYTPLMRAATAGSMLGVRVLLDHGANMYAKTKRGSTIVQEASKKGHVAVVQMLHNHERKLQETVIHP